MKILRIGRLFESAKDPIETPYDLRYVYTVRFETSILHSDG